MELNHCAKSTDNSKGNFIGYIHVPCHCISVISPQFSELDIKNKFEKVLGIFVTTMLIIYVVSLENTCTRESGLHI